jgi:hypothetical protein
MPDSVIGIEKLIGTVVLALGGQEGIRQLIIARKRKNGNGHVTKEFCNERTGNLKEMVESIQADVKLLLQRPHP